MSKPTLALIYPALTAIGGGQSVAIWTIQALKEDYDITVFSFAPVDLDSHNRAYGTDIKEDEVKFHEFPPMIKRLTEKQRFSLHQHIMIRYFRKLRPNFDVAFSAFNEMDFGIPGIQYVHYPMFGHGHEKAREIVNYPDSPLRRVYRKSMRLISNFSDEEMAKNLTLTNSEWTANIIKQSYGIDAIVIYPPVMSQFPQVAWEDRENSFIAVGRVVREKKVERSIRIIQKVRDLGHDVKLRITAGRGDKEYLNEIRQLAKESGDWVILEGELSQDQLSSLIAHQKYGIHTRDNEQFGIGVAEMVKAGCIPFVPSSGGHMEIIAHNPHLNFSDEDEAAQKIALVLSDPDLQLQCREQLKQQINLFSVDRFVQEIQDAVRNFLVKE